MNDTHSIWIKDPLAILADGAERGVVVSGGRVVELVGAGQAPTTSGTVAFDASAHVVLPGLVNTHHHFYQTLTRAVPAAQDADLFHWLVTLYPIWAPPTAEAIYVSSKVAMAELILSGCTTSSDHTYIWPNGARLDDQVRAAREMGLRF